MTPLYSPPSVTIQTTANVSAMLNAQVNCAGRLYGSAECKMAIADLEEAGGIYLRDQEERFQPHAVRVTYLH